MLTDAVMSLGHGVADVGVGVQPEQRGVVVERQSADVARVVLDRRRRLLLGDTQMLTSYELRAYELDYDLPSEINRQ